MYCILCKAYIAQNPMIVETEKGKEQICAMCFRRAYFKKRRERHGTKKNRRDD